MNIQNRKSDDTTQLVTFRLGQETYGIDIFKIQEVIHSQKISSIPKSPRFVEGVIEVRNQIIPVINLKKRLGIRADGGYKRRIVILDLDGRLLGVIVDDISKVIKLEGKRYEVLPDMVMGEKEKACINRLAKTDEGLIIIISPERILSKRERKALNDFEKIRKQELVSNAS
jgi:purine-binding chemotaxis protein CheW